MTDRMEHLKKLQSNLAEAQEALAKAEAHKAAMIDAGFPSTQLWPAVDTWADQVQILTDKIAHIESVEAEMQMQAQVDDDLDKLEALEARQYSPLPRFLEPDEFGPVYEDWSG